MWRRLHLVVLLVGWPLVAPGAATNRAPSRPSLFTQIIRAMYGYSFVPPATPATLDPPLYQAASRGDLPEVRRLLDEGESVSATNSAGNTALHVAARNGCVAVARLLLARGADAASLNRERQNPLHVAAAQGHADVVDLLVEFGAPVNLENAQGRTPLLLACMNRHATAAAHLLNRGARVQDRDRSGRTALMHAASKGDLGLARLLVARGAEVNAVDSRGWAPLDLAVHAPSPDTARFLLARGADPNLPNSRCDALRQCVRNRDPVLLMDLIAAGADLEAARTGTLFRAVHFAADLGATEELKLLLDAGADIEAQSADGYTPLLRASWRNQPEIVRLLLERGANVRHRSSDGWTAYMLADQCGHTGVVSVLARFNGGPLSDDPPKESVTFLIHQPAATQVFVSGTFNAWNDDLWPLTRGADGIWTGTFSLYRGVYGYKFVSDGVWKMDPGNPETLLDPAWNTLNSRLDTATYRTPDPVRMTTVTLRYTNATARRVSLAGEFNRWNSQSHAMKKTGPVWTLSLEAPAGEYGYKFVVDGMWQLDPANGETRVVDGVTNSLLRISL